MLQGLKITVYDIKASPPFVLEAPLDYNLYILLAIVGLNYVPILLLVAYTEDLFIPFSFALLYRTLVTLHVHSLLLRLYIPML